MTNGRTQDPLLNRLQDEFERFFGDFLGELPPFRDTGWTVGRSTPALNLWEDENNIYAESEVPGVSRDDLDVEVLGRKLTIRGERKADAPDGATTHRKERRHGAFERVVELPSEIDVARVEAALEDGILRLTLPKHEGVKPRKVNIKGTSE